MNPRIKKLASLLQEPCLIENPVDLLYLTGLTLSKGRVLVDSKEVKLFVDDRYYDRAKKAAPCPVFKEKEFPEELKNVQRVAFDSAFLTYEQFLALQNRFPQTEFVPISKPLKGIRVCKDSHEIDSLKKAAHLTWRGFELIKKNLKEGISEEELALEFEIFCLKNGAKEFSFEPIIAFGENSAYPHYRAGKAKLKKNQIVLIDIGAVVENYRGDMTRVLFFGTPDPELARFDQIVKRAFGKAFALVKPGIRVGDLDIAVRKEFQKEGLENLFTHSLGHGIGLETHEFPLIREDREDRNVILKEGMVFTIEPGLYQPGLGGVRFEDTVLVTAKGCENFYEGNE